MNSRQHPRIVGTWVNLALVLLAVLFGVISVGNFLRAGLDQPWWVWAVLVALILAILRFTSARQVSRLRALRGRYPQAYVQLVALYPLPVGQLSEAASKGTFTTRSLRPNTTGVLVLGGTRLDIYGGLFFGTGGQPNLLASGALPPDVDVTSQKAAQGRYYLTSLTFASSTSDFRLDLCPMRSYFGLFVTVFRSRELGEQRTHSLLRF